MGREKGTVPIFTPGRLAASLRDLIPGYPQARLCVAVSGGVDSMALLHAARELASGEALLRLRAIHVDHGLQAASADWARHCEAACAALGVRLDLLRLALTVARGASVEAEARRARYAALAAAVEPGEYLLTAHHADDQLETVLLQLFRGAGVRGLAAMPRTAPLGSGVHLRPLLEVGRAELEQYAAAAGLSWIDDPMNDETRYDRAYLRQQVLPAARRRWPSVAATVGRAAGHLARAQQSIDALAAIDAGGLVDGGRLEIAGLLGLPRARQAHLLRWWIAARGLGLPSAARLDAVLDDLVPARGDALPVVTWRDGELRRYRGRLYAMRPLAPPPPAGWQQPIEPGQTIELPGGLGSLTLGHSVGEGIAAEAVAGRLSVAFRAGGETLRRPGRGSAHTLGNLFRQAGIVPWMRPRLPLVCDGTRVIAVPGLWIAAGCGAAPGRAGAVPGWRGGPAVT